MGLLNGGTVPGVLFLVYHTCVCGAAFRMHDLVGLFVVVMGGAFCTLSTYPSPSEVGNVSTLCDGVGRVAVIVLRAFAQKFSLRRRR